MSKKERKLPKWMYGKRAAVGDAISNIVTTAKPLTENKNFLNDNDDDTAAKRRLRSNYEFPKTEQELKALQPRFNVDDLPMVTYDGRIHYLADFYEIAEAFENLIKKVEAHPGDEGEMVGVAFDMEWTFSFQTGPEKTSLIQVCIDIHDCYLFHLPNLKKLPASLGVFLSHPRVRLHGVNIKNDLRKLERDFPTVKADPIIDNCVDLGVWYNEVYNSSGRWSMERLVLQTLRMRIDKNRQTRMSKWHEALNAKQKLYAAIDVFIAQKIYHHILSKQRQDSNNLQDFFSVYGDELSAETAPTKSDDISNEIEKLMQQNQA